VFRDIRYGNFAQEDRDRVLGGAARPADVLHYPSDHLGPLLAGFSAPGIASNQYLIRRRWSAGNVLIARRNVVEDHLDHKAGRPGHLMIYGGDTLGDFRFLDWRQPS
jgi:hypothetical protein